MSDYGDFCREQREWKQAVRRYWLECPDCAVRFGTGTSVAPGCKCRNCSWISPGEKGSDVKSARAEIAAQKKRKPSAHNGAQS